MYFVLKYNGVGPDDFLENCYDEVIVVKNRIALVQFEHNKNKLLGMQFEEIGMVENEDGLKELFKDKTVQVKHETKIVDLNKILAGDPESEQKSWYQNLQ